MCCLLLQLQRISAHFRCRLTLWPAAAFQSRRSAPLAERRLMNHPGGEGCACPSEPSSLLPDFHLQPQLRCGFAELWHFPLNWKAVEVRDQFMWRKMQHLLGFAWNRGDCAGLLPMPQTHVCHVCYDPPDLFNETNALLKAKLDKYSTLSWKHFPWFVHPLDCNTNIWSMVLCRKLLEVH